MTDTASHNGSPSWLSVADVAAQLGFRRETIRTWISEGRLPATRIGRAYRISSADLDELLHQRKDAAR